MDIAIRHATVDDIPELVRMGYTMHQESRYAELDFDPEMYAGALLYANAQGLVFVAEADGKLVGGFAGRIAEYFFGRDTFSHDLMTYVRPEYRGRTGWLLIKRYLAEAKASGVKSIYIGESADILPQRVRKLYERLGFTPAGNSYVYTPDNEG